MPKHIFIEGSSRTMKFSSAWKKPSPVPGLGARLTISKGMRFNPLRRSTPQPNPVSRDVDGSRLRSPAETTRAVITAQQRSREEANREGAATSSTAVCQQEWNNVEELYPGGVGNSFVSQLNSLHNEDNQENEGGGGPQPDLTDATVSNGDSFVSDEHCLSAPYGAAMESVCNSAGAASPHYRSKRAPSKTGSTRPAKARKYVLTGRPVPTRCHLESPSGTVDLLDTASESSRSSALTRSFGARIVQQYNERQFTTEALTATIGHVFDRRQKLHALLLLLTTDLVKKLIGRAPRPHPLQPINRNRTMELYPGGVGNSFVSQLNSLHNEDNQRTKEAVDLSRDHGWHQDVLCSFCGSNLQSKDAICEDAISKLQSANPTLNTSDKRIVVTSCDTSVQLKEIIERKFEVIQQCHREANDDMHTTRRRDCRDFKTFREGIESSDEFRSKELRLQLLLSMDGFTYPENERGSTWFTTARILDIPPSLRVLKGNSMLVSSISSGRIPNHSEFWTATSGFLELMKTSPEHPIAVLWKGDQYKISFGVTFVTADHQTSRLAKMGTYTPRTPLSVKRDIGFRINGVYGESVFSEICPMSNVIVDFLHNGQEGFIGKIIEETFPANRKTQSASWPIRLLQADIERLDRLLRTTTLSLFEFVVHIIAFERTLDRKSSTAAVFALLFVLKMETSVEVLLNHFGSTDLTSYNFAVGCLVMRAPCLDFGDSEILSGIFDRLFGHEFATIKKHWLFDHHAEDLLKSAVRPELSASCFEKDYRLHKKAVAVGNTRAVEQASWSKTRVVFNGFVYGSSLAAEGKLNQNHVISF
ncbi:hypothetical protein ANCCAN_23576, partial [Ancylostoma caninum]